MVGSKALESIVRELPEKDSGLSGSSFHVRFPWDFAHRPSTIVPDVTLPHLVHDHLWAVALILSSYSYLHTEHL